MAALASSLSLSGAFARMSARERKLLAGLALVALVLAPVKALDMRAKAVAENDAAHVELDAARSALRRASGQGVASRLQETREDIIDWSWSAPSPAVGQVVAQSALSDMAATGGLSAAETRALGRPEAAGVATLVAVEVTAPFSWSGLSGFLGALSASGRGFILESVTKTDDKEPKVRIVVRLPIVIEEQTAA